MKKSNNAAIFSAFVFPGAGHFYLKKYIMGFLLSGITLVPLYLIIASVVNRTLQVTDKIMSGEVQPDLATIMDLVSQQSADPGAESLQYVWLVLIGVWLVGIADSYRVGRLQDKSAN